MRVYSRHGKGIRASFVCAALLTILPLLSGCDQSYPEDLTYPVRTDAICTKTPTSTPSFLDSPGELNELIVDFKMLGGDIVDPGLTATRLQIKKLRESPKSSSEAQADANEKIAALEKKISKWEGPWNKMRPKLDEELQKLFGTPASPKVDGIGPEAVKTLGIDSATLAEGSKLYRQQCLHCHGLTGDGRGPTGPWVNPHPRDYRRGYFKFTSTKGGNERKPRREDLVRTLREGIDGSSMPSFGQLPGDQLEKMVSYVIHLSIRGETEVDTIRALAGAFDEDKGEFDISQLEGGSLHAHVTGSVNTIGERWTTSAGNVIQPAPYQFSDKDLGASIARGYGLFTKPGEASCVSCHANFGRQFSYRWDEWGTIVRPADLTGGIYRGGRRPVDLYFRIHSGILGAGMPGFAKEASGAGLENNQVWDLVNFLQALPYPAMLEKAAPEVHKAIYPQ